MIDSCTHAIISMISSLQSETHQTKNRNISFVFQSVDLSWSNRWKWSGSEELSTSSQSASHRSLKSFQKVSFYITPPKNIVKLKGNLTLITFTNFFAFFDFLVFLLNEYRKLNFFSRKFNWDIFDDFQTLCVFRFWSFSPQKRQTKRNLVKLSVTIFSSRQESKRWRLPIRNKVPKAKRRDVFWWLCHTVTQSFLSLFRLLQWSTDSTTSMYYIPGQHAEQQNFFCQLISWWKFHFR